MGASDEEMKQADVFVVIPNWNLKEDTTACVESVLASSYSGQRVVIVDNGSQDGSPDALLDSFGAKIDQIVHKDNLGYAKGVNAGIRHALARGAEYLLLLNNDTLVDAKLIEHLIEASKSDTTMAVLGPAIYYQREPERFWRLGAVKRRWLPVPLEIGRNALDTGQFPAPFDVDYVTGCAMWVPAKVFQEVGLLDEGYFMYFEDADFCRRVRSADHRITVVPQARVWHKVSASTTERRPWAAYYRTRNRIVFYSGSKTGPVSKTLAYLYIMIGTLGQIARAWRDEPLASSLWRGLRDGWHARADTSQAKDSC
jgi:GT2 family glycosyltransferase